MLNYQCTPFVATHAHKQSHIRFQNTKLWRGQDCRFTHMSHLSPVFPAICLTNYILFNDKIKTCFAFVTGNKGDESRCCVVFYLSATKGLQCKCITYYSPYKFLMEYPHQSSKSSESPLVAHAACLSCPTSPLHHAVINQNSLLVTIKLITAKGNPPSFVIAAYSSYIHRGFC